MNDDDRAALALHSLRMLALGDAFGESFFGPRATILQHLQDQTVPESSWEYTDDTVMAIPITDQLVRTGRLDSDALAQAWAKNHALDPHRGYGATARRILRAIEEGEDWRVLAPAVFEGMGSMGNGAAMRVGPIGAYYWDDLPRVMALAEQSAVVTHAHAEGIAGAVAVGVGAAVAARAAQGGIYPAPNDFLTEVAHHVPDTDTRAKILKSTTLSSRTHPDTLTTVLGNGNRMTTQDTVPVALWCTAHYLQDAQAALWRAVGVLGDRDTICAMVGSMVGLSANETTLPLSWRTQVEAIKDNGFWEH